MAKKDQRLTEALNLEITHIETALSIALAMTTDGKMITLLNNAKAAANKAFNLDGRNQ